MLSISPLSYFSLQINHLSHRIFTLASIFLANFVKKCL